MRFCPRCGTRYGDEFNVCTEDGTKLQEMPPEPAADPFVGTVVDNRYRIEKLIGEGGMGLVYQVTHVAIGKRLAMKVLRGEMARDKEVVQRFIQEAQSASSIGHENIIGISDFGRLPDDSVYFVMEFLDGESLTAVIGRGGSIPVSEAIHIIRQIASALGAAHARGIVHRDLKPDNIYLVKRGDGSTNFVKVLDFGIAKVGGAASKLTKAGMVFGTPHYMSPEQAAGQTVDHRTDIYALGVIMYEMFVGRVPFDADTFMGILTKHMFEPPTPISQATPGGSRLGALEDITMKALEKKPESRYQSMAELIGDLERMHTGAQSVVKIGMTRSDSLADALEPMSRTEYRLSMSGDETAKAPSRGKGVLIGAAIALVVVGAAAAAWFGLSKSAESDAATSPPAHAASGATTPALPPSPPGPSAVQERAPTAPTQATVTITSTPPQASVFVDGALIGTTPAMLPMPSGAGTQSVEVRASGFVTQTVLITSSSAASLAVTLPREEAAPSRRAGGSRGSTPPPPARTEEGPPPRRRDPRPTSQEVLDPWN